MEIITLSLGRNILKEGSRENLRMHSYAKQVEALHVIVLTRKEHGYTSERQSGTLHLYPTNSLSRFTMLVDAFRIGWRITRDKKSVVISAQDPLEIGWVSALLAFLSPASLHLQVHGDYFSSGWASHSLYQKLRRGLGLMLLKRARAVRVVSERIKVSLVNRGVSASRITVLPIRPELETFLATSKKPKEDSRTNFLYMGRLAPEKDIERIVRAFSKIREEHKEAFLEIVGEGKEGPKIEKLVDELGLSGRVTLSPWIENPALKLATADVFLLASAHEAYALTLIEALAVGVPVVTTDVGCVGEVVEDEVHGIVVRETGIEPYARALTRMIEDVDFRERCGAEGKKMVEVLSNQNSEEEYARAWVTSVSRAQENV